MANKHLRTRIHLTRWTGSHGNWSKQSRACWSTMRPQRRRLTGARLGRGTRRKCQQKRRVDGRLKSRPSGQIVRSGKSAQRFKAAQIAALTRQCRHCADRTLTLTEVMWPTGRAGRPGRLSWDADTDTAP